MTFAELIEHLRKPCAYPHPPASQITALQTHISVIIFVDDHVYKIKKPRKLDFLDYSTLELRKHFCEEEVRLNARLAADVYLGVVEIVRTEDGGIRVGVPGEIIEYAVQMIRLPHHRLMSNLLERGEIDNQQIDALVRILADFHSRAETGQGVDEFGSVEEIRTQLDDNLIGLDDFLSDAPQNEGADVRTLSTRSRDHLRTHAHRWLDVNKEVLEQRIGDGRIRNGHGDLHTGNICFWNDRFIIYDCIEFSARFRCRDVACELAFLAMDFDLKCYRGFARYLLHQYAAITDDADLPHVASLYKLHLAIVRGKVASMRANDDGVAATEREESRIEAMRYFQLAASYTMPAVLILMCGLPASGKSHAARAIRRPFEAVVLRSDVIRKELARHGGSTDIYTPAFTRRTYDEILSQARYHLQQSRCVVVDATFSQEALRSQFIDAAQQLHVPWVLVEVTADERTVHHRMQQRATDTDEVSDANWQVYLDAKQRYEPPVEVPAEHLLRLESGGPGEDASQAVVDRLIGLI